MGYNPTGNQADFFLILTADTLIARRKITDYLLAWRLEDDKFAFLARAGYTPQMANRLLADLRTQLLPLEARPLERDEYGAKYEIRGKLTGPNGRALRVVSIWMIEGATGHAKFVTLYPDKT
jgi:hypothetical protein